MIDLRTVPCRLCRASITVLPDEVGSDLMAECSAHTEAYSADPDPDMPQVRA